MTATNEMKKGSRGGTRNEPGDKEVGEHTMSDLTIPDTSSVDTVDAATAVEVAASTLRLIEGGAREWTAEEVAELRELVTRPNLVRPGEPGPDWCAACPCPWEALPESPEEWARTHRAVVGQVADVEIAVEQTDTQLASGEREAETVVTIAGEFDITPRQAAELSKLLMVAGFRADHEGR